jgi:hypothetical protein
MASSLSNIILNPRRSQALPSITNFKKKSFVDVSDKSLQEGNLYSFQTRQEFAKEKRQAKMQKIEGKYSSILSLNSNQNDLIATEKKI